MSADSSADRSLDGQTGPMRLDAALVARGLVATRSKAARLVKAGRVSVDGRTVARPAATVGPEARLAADLGDDYVSRGALKLVGAYQAFAPHGLPAPEGMDCLDIGASTGGFTEVLLRRGARRVIALDVGHGQLDPRIAGDPRVIEMSGTNIRDVAPGDLPYAPQVVVSDVSFISLSHVIPPVARLAAPGAHVILLVKPQFEVGRARLGKNGIVTDPAARRQALADVTACAEANGLRVVTSAPSPIEGTHGNMEYLLYARTA
ncbi:TlyA family RNA methyltransferase [Bifidobacterium longum]|uniref:TlyA family RNA methyltransferase n=1 Tax=Bifidobacterium longum TaxID=216816 RepID=UPI0019266389|nr:TlyA family RNA methyltransferase [Bifidobacterium longum]MBL3897315.1 TlyA family RNA methyltransferase [Bifidobacterium longum subsp. suis]